MTEMDFSSVAWEFLLTASGARAEIQSYQDANFDLFFNDMRALGENGARNVLLVMMGYLDKIPPKDYMKIAEKGWVFPTDFDIDNPVKYGYDSDGNPLTGNLAVSPNGLNSVSVFDISRHLQQQELYKFFQESIWQKITNYKFIRKCHDL